MKKLLSGFAAFSLVVTVQAAGFGLYEMSAKAVGMGGHVYGKPVDASANYYNPAGLSSLTGTWATVGFTTLHPLLDTKVNGQNTHKMDPGGFFVPNAFVSQELPWGFTAGVGFYADYGLGSHYDNSWPLSWDSVESKFEALTVNPNLAYKITDKWSIAAGVRLTHASFTQRRIIPMPAMYGGGRMNVKFDVDNDIDVGYVIGTQYKILDNLSIGAVYRTRIRTDLEGKSEADNSPAARLYRGHIDEKFDLPSAATVGVNWDITEDWHLGSSLTWTEWSTVDVISFKLPAGVQNMNLGWHNAYRTGLGLGYDFTPWWTGLVGYTYDMDPTRIKRAATMLPCGDRHMVSFGSSFHWGNWDLSATYGLIIMETETMYITSSTGQRFKFQTENPYTHCVACTLSYHF